MDTKQVVKWSVTVAALLAFQYANATPPGDLPADVYRVNYANSADMPEHIAYLSLMQNIRNAEAETGRAANLVHIQTHLSLEQADADRFVDLVLTSYEEMIDTNRTVTNRMLCTGDKPRYETNQAYAVLDILDDLKETNLRKQYRRALVELGADKSGQLNAWLEVIKSGSSHHKYDHEQVFKHSDVSVEQVIATACTVIDSYVVNR